MSMKLYLCIMCFMVLSKEGSIRQEQRYRIRRGELISNSLFYTPAQSSMPPGNEISSATSSQTEISVKGELPSFQGSSPPTYLLYD